eukprot:2742601-Pleurochrysis_carterae.AAC.1
MVSLAALGLLASPLRFARSWRASRTRWPTARRTLDARRARTPARAHTCARLRTHAYTCAHLRTPTPAPTPTPTPTPAPTRALVVAHAHPCARARRRAGLEFSVRVIQLVSSADRPSCADLIRRNAVGPVCATPAPRRTFVVSVLAGGGADAPTRARQLFWPARRRRGAAAARA